MTEAERLAAEINNALPVKSGTLRFFGEWFGRPYDNCHEVVTASAAGDELILSFNEGETLTIWNPTNANISDTRFEIVRASRVRWEWFLYGREKTNENRRFEDFQMTDGAITVRHDIDWYKPNFKPRSDKSAVCIFGPFDK